MVGPERVLERISEGVKNRKLDGISGAIDLTDRHNGTRLVIEIKTGFDPNAVLAQLFKHTPLQDNFTINNVALVNPEIKEVNIPLHQFNPFPLPESGAFNKQAVRLSTKAFHSAGVLK